MSSDPFVSFVTPVRDDAERLERCLRSIKENDYPPDRFEIVVVDNESVDDSAAVAQELGARVVVSQAPSVAGLRNIGASAARGEILAFVDADHELGPGWLRAAADALRAPNVAVAGDYCHAPAGGNWVQQTYDGFRTRGDGTRDVAWLGSGNMAIARHVFEAIGGFDATLETCEDVDLCQRIRRAGYRLVRNPALWNVHFGDPSSLGKLFRGELWRGRDNIRVSRRSPLTLREVPSVAIPMIDLACLVILCVGLLSFSRLGLALAAIAGAVVVGFASLRAARIAHNGRRRGLGPLGQAFAVAFVYDLARALALAVRPAWHRRAPPLPARNRPQP